MNVTAPIQPNESVATTVIELRDKPVGVPLMSPVVAFNIKPGGKMLFDKAHVTAPVAPLTVSGWLYVAPNTASGKLAGVITSTPQVLTVKLREPVQPAASVAVMVKVALPAVVGVPLITPVVPLSIKPAGSEPFVTLNANVPVAPVALTVWLYAVPTVASGSAAGFTASPVQPGDKVYCAEAGQPFASVAVMVNVVPALLVGVPLKVAPVRVKPCGNVPAVTAKVTAPVAPAVPNVTE